LSYDDSITLMDAADYRVVCFGDTAFHDALRTRLLRICRLEEET
jgi:hypothetical protein